MVGGWETDWNDLDFAAHWTHRTFSCLSRATFVQLNPIEHNKQSWLLKHISMRDVLLVLYRYHKYNFLRYTWKISPNLFQRLKVLFLENINALNSDY